MLHHQSSYCQKPNPSSSESCKYHWLSKGLESDLTGKSPQIKDAICGPEHAYSGTIEPQSFLTNPHCSRLERETVDSFRILRDQVSSPVIPETGVQLSALGIGIPLDPRQDHHSLDQFFHVDTRVVNMARTKELMSKDHVYCLR